MIRQLMTTFAGRVRRKVRPYSQSTLQKLLTPEQIRRVLDRERMRSDRTGEVFSLAVFSAEKDPASRDTLPHVAKILLRRLRLTDDAGMLDDRRIGVVLPATGAEGAWTVVDDVCVCVPAGLPLPECRVYCYPVEQLDDEVNSSDDRREREKVRAEAMDPLFLHRLPLWKRAIDVLGASLGIVMFSPVFILAALAIKISSRGPVFFRQKRSGLGGREFVMIKFRSMVVDAEDRKLALMALNEQDGPAFKIKNDPRVTRVGRLLRKTSIDELPQLWNVLRGDMSLVGPRPLPCHETEACRGWHRRRLDVTPGLTCIWQVRGRSTVSFSDWARMDVEYIRTRSFWGDVKLLFQTVPAVLMRKGAS